MAHDYILLVSNHTNEQKFTLEIILKFDIDPTPSHEDSKS
jgi:hypothetical protein